MSVSSNSHLHEVSQIDAIHSFVRRATHNSSSKLSELFIKFLISSEAALSACHNCSLETCDLAHVFYGVIKLITLISFRVFYNTFDDTR